MPPLSEPLKIPARLMLNYLKPKAANIYNEHIVRVDKLEFLLSLYLINSKTNK